jgi:nitrous oxidase accessory protein
MRLHALAIALLAGLTLAAPSSGRVLQAPAEPGAAARALAEAAAGDTVLLGPGAHAGPLVIARPLTLRGEPGAVVDGGGRASVLTVAAGGAVVEDLALRGSGARILTADAGLHVRQAAGVSLRRLKIRDVLYGIHGERADGLRIEDCSLEGRVRPGDENGAGNGLHLWYTHDAVMLRDTSTRFLDGIYLSFADRAHVEASVLEDAGRYGLHTMYCQGGRIRGSRFQRNVAGCAIMFSNDLHLESNDFCHNRGPRTYGVLLRDCSAGRFTGNRLVDNTIAVFMDNSNRNLVRDNLVQDNGWGVLLFSSCAGNVFTGNAFIHNDYPVALDMRRSNNRFDDGTRGNYWGESAPYDLDGDRVSDVPFSPVSAFAFVSKQYPDLSILARSPAVAALAVAERVIPALRPSEIVDHLPMVAPPALAGPAFTPGTDERPEPARGAALAYAALAGLGLVGIAAGALRRTPSGRHA